MSLRPVLPLFVLLASACGSNSPSTPTCPAHCPTGQVCGITGTCVPLNSSGGSAALTCSQADKPDGVSFSFGGSRLDTDNVAVPHKVQSPGGSIQFNDLDDGSSLPPPGSGPDYYANRSVFFFSDSPATGTLTIPNTSQGLTVANGGTGLPAGSWSMVVSDLAWECQTGVLGTGVNCLAGAADSTYEVTVIAKPLGASSHVPSSGQLDVVVYFATATAGGSPLTAATADADADLTRMKQTLTGLFAKAGITSVNVAFKDLPADVQNLYATGVHVDQSGACAELPQLLKNAAPGNTFNAFLVSDFIESGSTSTNTPTIVGIDGTIPGPASIGGTVASGAAVSAASLRHNSGTSFCQGSPNYQGCGADETAYIMAHEAGHFLGLYHVTEEYGAEFDPLLDTPTCVCKDCSSTPSTCADHELGTPPLSADKVRVSECLGVKPGCGGGDNLMFWLLGTGSQGVLTAEQGQVMRANPLIH